MLRAGPTARGTPCQGSTASAAARAGRWILRAPGGYRENGSSDPELRPGVLIRAPGLRRRGPDRDSVIVGGARPGGRPPCSSDPAFRVTGRGGLEVHKASVT